jgi:hypothetical protein
MECGGCNMCCLVFPILPLEKKAGKWCWYCDIGVGCKIWDTKPDPCTRLRCAYFDMENCGIELRPDKCKVVFERYNGIMLGTLHPKKTYSSLSKFVKGQVRDFYKQGYSVVLKSFTEKPLGFPAKGKSLKEVQDELISAVKSMGIYDGSPSLR